MLYTILQQFSCTVTETSIPANRKREAELSPRQALYQTYQVSGESKKE